MVIRNRKGIGGPKSPEGKLRASKNSYKHGLTSSTPSSENEAKLISSFTKELVDYYKPKSPLEILQIDRIAICRAKLSHLYDVEQVRLELAHKDLELHPEKILEKISGAVGVTKAMALEIIENQKMAPICNLTLNALEPIVLEVSMFCGVISTTQHFKRAFPLLSKYLITFEVAGLNNEERLPEKLVAVAKRISQYLSPDGKFEQFIYYQNLGHQYEVLLNKYENTGFDKEIEEYQKESRKRHGLPEKDSTDKFIRQDEPNFLSTDTLTSHFQAFESLLMHMKKAEKVVTQFFELKALMKRAITLPASESNLLMRYQTTLERRLSSAIGELLELQKRAAR